MSVFWEPDASLLAQYQRTVMLVNKGILSIYSEIFNVCGV